MYSFAGKQTYLVRSRDVRTFEFLGTRVQAAMQLFCVHVAVIYYMLPAAYYVETKHCKLSLNDTKRRV